MDEPLMTIGPGSGSSVPVSTSPQSSVRSELLSCRAAGEELDQGRLPLHQAVAGWTDNAQVVKRVHAIRALRSSPGVWGPQQQFAEDGDLVAGEIKSFLEPVLILLTRLSMLSAGPAFFD